jgi:hypothetical protein
MTKDLLLFLPLPPKPLPHWLRNGTGKSSGQKALYFFEQNLAIRGFHYKIHCAGLETFHDQIFPALTRDHHHLSAGCSKTPTSRCQ